MLKIIGLACLDLAMLACIIVIPLGLPGAWILLALALLAAWLGGFAAIGWQALALMLLLVILAEILEAILGSAMARKFGASWWGVFGAFAGGFLGAIIGSAILPLIGTLAGAFLGAAAGAVALEAWHQRRLDQSALRAGWGAFLGKLLAALLKVSLAAGIAAYVILRTHR
jgi:hypothetical protein